MSRIYQTAGRQRLLKFLESRPDRQFTVEELCVEMDRQDGETSRKSTVYRHLSRLCDEGAARKYRSDTQSAYVYQYLGQGDCSRHFHLKCVSCGELVHLDCCVSEELLAHIRSDHGFQVDSGRSILYGVCQPCADLKKNDHDREAHPHGCACGRREGHGSKRSHL